MHPSQYWIVDQMIEKYFPKPANEKTVYDVGSYDINGNHKPSVVNRGFKYVGVDISAGPNVDLVVRPYDWSPLPENGCELIISGSCLEHVEAIWLWAKELEWRLAPKGICIVHLPLGAGEHRCPVDCWRIMPDGLKFLFTKWAAIDCLECGFTSNGWDTYFVGRKRTS